MNAYVYKQKIEQLTFEYQLLLEPWKESTKASTKCQSVMDNTTEMRMRTTMEAMMKIRETCQVLHKLGTLLYDTQENNCNK